MSQAASFETIQGYVPPSVTQFSVFLDNKVGKLLELLETFDQDANCQVCAFTVHDASDYAVVRVITNSAQCARGILRRHELPFAEKQVLIVELCDPAEFSRMCVHLLGAELNIHFAYPVMLRSEGKPTIAMAVDDITLAGQILRKKNFRLLGEEDLPRPTC